MPKRPRSHEIEDISRQRLRSIFGKLGWVVWDLYPDYGEDLLVRIFIEAKATHYSFFVQAKSTDKIEKYIQKGGTCLSYPIDIEHIEHWNNFWEPVVLTVWDSKSDTTYWTIIQDFLKDKNLNTQRKKTMNVKIPINNILNEESLNSILLRTRERYKRFEHARSGISILIEYLEERFNVDIIYDENANVLLINDKIRPVEAVFFDAIPENINEFITTSTIAHEQSTTGEMSDYVTMSNIVIEYSKEGNILVFSGQGDFLESYQTLEEFHKDGFEMYNRIRKNIKGDNENG